MPAPEPPAAPPQPTPQPVGNAPAAAGMMAPQQPQGEIEAAKLDVFHAVKLLDRAIGKIGQEGDIEQILKARAVLTKRFGEFEDTSEEFSPAELKRMLASLAGPGAAGPGAQPQTPPTPGGAPTPPMGQG